MVSASLGFATVIFASLFGMLLWDELMPASSWLAVGLTSAGIIGVRLATLKPAVAGPCRHAAATD